jgi:hypothetical protein
MAMIDSAVLPMWTIYNHPKDYPKSFVARLWYVGAGGSPIPTDQVIVFPTLEAIRDRMRAQGLTRLMRNENDDPVIIETWL